MLKTFESRMFEPTNFLECLASKFQDIDFQHRIKHLLRLSKNKMFKHAKRVLTCLCYHIYIYLVFGRTYMYEHDNNVVIVLFVMIGYTFYIIFLFSIVQSLFCECCVLT